MYKVQVVYQAKWHTSQDFTKDELQQLVMDIGENLQGHKLKYIEHKSVVVHQFAWNNEKSGDLTLDIAYDEAASILQIHSIGHKASIYDNTDPSPEWERMTDIVIDGLIKCERLNLKDAGIGKEEEEIVSIIDNTREISDPFIVLTRNKEGNIPVDVEMLYKSAKGMCQIIARGNAPDMIEHHTVKDGIAGICLPDGHIITADPRRFTTPMHFVKAVKDIVLDWQISRYDNRLSLDAQITESLHDSINELNLKSERHKETAEIDYEKFMEDIEALEKDKVLKQNRIEALEKELNGLRKNISCESGDELIVYGKEKDLFYGEIKDFILLTIKEALSGIKEGTRRYDVLKDILDNNDYEKLHEDRREAIKTNLVGWKNIASQKLIQDLNEAGIEVIKGGKHNKLIPFNDERYVMTMASTPSDRYAGASLARDINKMLN